SLAYPRHAAESALLRPHNAQRSRLLSRLFLVLFHQRAPAALSEPALSARLQHRAAPLFLGLSSALAVPLERLFAGRRAGRIPPGGQSRARAPAGVLLDRLRSGVLHFFDHAGILLDAV